jgi:endonuclease/exonuclease/phosphatase family metal-dependent hydrolase
VTFNIQHGAEGLVRVAHLLRELAPDVVFLQEVDRGCRRSGGTDQALMLANALGAHFAFGQAFPFDEGAYGLALLSRQPMTNVRSYELPHEGPPQDDGRGEPRILLCADVGALTICNTHLGLGPAERIAQVERLRHVLSPEPLPVVLGGDFNEHRASQAVQSTLTWLHDTFDEARGEEHSTAPGDRPHGRIDYIFRSEHAPNAMRAFIGPAGYSDHRPVIVDFAV